MALTSRGMLTSLLVVGLASCGVVADRALVLPEGLFIDYGAPPVAGDSGDDHSRALSQLQPFVIPLRAEGPVTPFKDPSFPIQVRQIPDGGTQFEGRSFYAVNASIHAGSFPLEASGEFKTVLEVHLGRDDPQFTIEYTVDPQALYRLAGSKGGAVPVFARYAFAPGILMQHTLRSAEAKVGFPVLLTAASGLFSSYTRSLAGRFALLRHYDLERVKAVTSGEVAIFEGADERQVNSSASPRDRVFDVDGKRYRCSDVYAEHLLAENVKFNSGGPMGVYIPDERSFVSAVEK